MRRMNRCTCGCHQGIEAGKWLGITAAGWCVIMAIGLVGVMVVVSLAGAVVEFVFA